MPATACPRCRAPNPRKLTVLSDLSDVDYFRCNDCVHWWTVTKDGTRLVSHVTVHHEPHDAKHDDDAA
jgi:hypothetical protein